MLSLDKTRHKSFLESTTEWNLFRVIPWQPAIEEALGQLLDLISEGNLGLFVAAQRFDPIRFNNKFSSYCVYLIKTEAEKGGRGQGPFDTTANPRGR